MFRTVRFIQPPAPAADEWWQHSARDGHTAPGGPPLPGAPRRPRRTRGRRTWSRLRWAALLVVAALLFRRAIAWLALAALSACLHAVGLNVHLPSLRFGWPWQAITSGTTTDTQLGPWVLQKIEGISKPALGQVNFEFAFTRRVSRSIGPWPCWYSSTFYAVGHASATVDLNPGPAWWAPGSGHYMLRVIRAPGGGQPGIAQIGMTLPRPQLPQSAQDVTIDNLPSKPVATQHSWTYPGFGCGLLLRPQFAQSVLYAQAQRIAFYKADHVAAVTGPLIRSAENEAVQTVRDNFIQPTVNALGYTLRGFAIHWSAP